MHLICYSLTYISEFDHKVEIQILPKLVTQLIRTGGLSLVTLCSWEHTVLPFQKVRGWYNWGLAGGCMEQWLWSILQELITYQTYASGTSVSPRGLQVSTLDISAALRESVALLGSGLASQAVVYLLSRPTLHIQSAPGTTLGCRDEPKTSVIR